MNGRAPCFAAIENPWRRLAVAKGRIHPRNFRSKTSEFFVDFFNFLNAGLVLVRCAVLFSRRSKGLGRGYTSKNSNLNMVKTFFFVH